MTSVKAEAEYEAKASYDRQQATEYEKIRFSGPLGRYRWRVEQTAVAELVGRIPRGSSVLDCPCGIGRWWPLLLTRAGQLTAMDISPDMLEVAAQRPEALAGTVKLVAGDAEAIPLEDGSVDYVFSHALTKHLPWPVQYAVFREFGRDARKGVICSFSVVTPWRYQIWRRRKPAGSYPVLEEELEGLAQHARLRVVTMRHCTTPIGVERTVLFER